MKRFLPVTALVLSVLLLLLAVAPGVTKAQAITGSQYSVTAQNSTDNLCIAFCKQRIGENISSTSVEIGRTVNNVTVKLAKVGSPTGTLYVTVRDSIDNLVLLLGTKNVSTLTTTMTFYSFHNSTAFRTFQAGDKVLVEYNGPGRVTIGFNSIDAYDGQNTYYLKYLGAPYTNPPIYIRGTGDLTGIWSYVP